MGLAAGKFWENKRKLLKSGWLVSAALLAIGMVVPSYQRRDFRQPVPSPGDTVGWEPISLWQSPTVDRTVTGVTDFAAGVAGNASPRGDGKLLLATSLGPAPPLHPGEGEDRKLVRSSSLDLIVANPADTAERIRLLAVRLGGFLTNSQVNGSQFALHASVSIRVPAARFEQARAEIRKLGLRVESDHLEAQDVTRDYVDREARLRNLRAQEQQYLGILKRPATVKDTLEVSDTLNQVRGHIEQQQAEFEALSKQVETVAISVSLRTEADAQVFGLHWRPLYRLKRAARDGLDGVGDYLAAMTAVAFFLPTVLLWLMTILVGAALGWRILRWTGRTLFRQKILATERVGNS